MKHKKTFFMVTIALTVGFFMLEGCKSAAKKVTTPTTAAKEQKSAAASNASPAEELPDAIHQLGQAGEEYQADHSDPNDPMSDVAANAVEIAKDPVGTATNMTSDEGCKGVAVLGAEQDTGAGECNGLGLSDEKCAAPAQRSSVGYAVFFVAMAASAGGLVFSEYYLAKRQAFAAAGADLDKLLETRAAADKALADALSKGGSTAAVAEEDSVRAARELAFTTAREEREALTVASSGLKTGEKTTASALVKEMTKEEAELKIKALADEELRLSKPAATAAVESEEVVKARAAATKASEELASKAHTIQIIAEHSGEEQKFLLALAKEKDALKMVNGKLKVTIPKEFKIKTPTTLKIPADGIAGKKLLTEAELKTADRTAILGKEAKIAGMEAKTVKNIARAGAAALVVVGAVAAYKAYKNNKEAAAGGEGLGLNDDTGAAPTDSKTNLTAQLAKTADLAASACAEK